MDATQAEYYGNAVSGVYDLLYPLRDPKAVIDRFSELVAPGSQIIEAGAGNGRIALPLARAGFAVTAIDLSDAMLDALERKAGDVPVRTVKADITSTEVQFEGDVVAILNSTLFMLATQRLQAQFMQNAAGWLRAGGFLVVEAYNPLSIIPKTRYEQQFTILPDGMSILFDQIESDPVCQTLTFVRHYRGERVFSFVETSRYCYAGELDLLAAQAGFEPLAQWADWSGGIATAQDPLPVRVYRLSEARSDGV